MARMILHNVGPAPAPARVQVARAAPRQLPGAPRASERGALRTTLEGAREALGGRTRAEAGGAS